MEYKIVANIRQTTAAAGWATWGAAAAAAVATAVFDS